MNNKKPLFSMNAMHKLNNVHVNKSLMEKLLNFVLINTTFKNNNF